MGLRIITSFLTPESQGKSWVVAFSFFFLAFSLRRTQWDVRPTEQQVPDGLRFQVQMRRADGERS